MEMLEGVARVQLLAGLRGKVTALPEEELRTLAAPRSFAPRGAGED
jgi:hypothetical protein